MNLLMIQPILPRMPVNPQLFHSEMMVHILTFTLFLAVVGMTAFLISLYASKRFQSEKKKTALIFIGISLAASALLLCFFGCAVSAVQGTLFCLILLFTSFSDIKIRESDDYLAVMIALTAFIGIKVSEIPGMILSAVLITQKSQVIGKYAASNIYAGDYFTTAKITDEANTAEDVFASLDGTKVAFSITIDSFAAGLSGKLQNGDIISIIVTDKDTGATSIPGSLKYLQVITTTTAGGVDKDSIVKNDDGTFDLPSTVTVLVNADQAKLLAKYENNSTMQTALVYRGGKDTANKFLAKQDEYLKSAGGTANE
jgi:pilus assembly protein CpaB